MTITEQMEQEKAYEKYKAQLAKEYEEMQDIEISIKLNPQEAKKLFSHLSIESEIIDNFDD